MGLAQLQTLSYLDSGGARYLWAYLIIVNYEQRRILTEQDFILFGITLRFELGVLFKTIKRYLMEAWRALSALGVTLKHPRDMGLLSIVKHMKYKRKLIGAPRLDYCSISWDQVIAWTRKVKFKTRIDTIAFAVVSLAFTTIRRVGSFLPRNMKESKEFSWILPRFIRCNESQSTMLI